MTAGLSRMHVSADEGSDSAQDAMFEHLCATLLQQSHLCPVPLEAQPVFWNFDHALHLYPIPDVLVLADRVPCASFGFPAMPADQAEQSCVCLNPVSATQSPIALHRTHKVLSKGRPTRFVALFSDRVHERCAPYKL